MTPHVFSSVQSAIQKLQAEKTPLLVAIDGRCAAGKTTLAGQLQKSMCCNVFHMDDFFLPPDLRTKERLAQPGGNVDDARFRTQVLLPILSGNVFSYRPYDCHLQRQVEPVLVEPKPISIIEGCYSCHPHLWDIYDLRIFLNISKKEQLQRILQRNGVEQLNIFRERWIPLEERYFSAFRIPQRCDLFFSICESPLETPASDDVL